MIRLLVLSSVLFQWHNQTYLIEIKKDDWEGYEWKGHSSTAAILSPELKK